MRHKDRIYSIFSDAIRKAVEDKCATPLSQPSVTPDAMTRIWKAAEFHGAYSLIDTMLFRCGKYRLADCSDEELKGILGAIERSISPPAKRMQSHINLIEQGGGCE